VATTDLGLGQEKIDELNWTLRQVEAAKLNNGWDVAGKTGTWQLGDSTVDSAHTWMVGYTGAIAAAVWLGTTDGKALVTSSGSHQVSGAANAGAIWRQFMTTATQAMQLNPDKYRFQAPKWTNESASAAPAPTTVSKAPPSKAAPTSAAPAPAPSRPAPAPSKTPPAPPPTSANPSTPAEVGGAGAQPTRSG
jgi:membrane peptidoglycan carboxypeptidase